MERERKYIIHFSFHTKLLYLFNIIHSNAGVIRDRIVNNGTLVGSNYIPNQVCYWIVNDVNMVMSTVFDLEDIVISPVLTYLV